MIIAVDIGNSSINIGFFENKEPIVKTIATYPLRGKNEYIRIIRENLMDNPLQGSIILSVVPGHTPTLREALLEVTKKEPIEVGASMVDFMVFDLDDREGLGSDRVASAVGAYILYGAPSAVVDFGTATTINFIAKGGVFKGGSIMPGLALMAEILSKRTAKLPLIGLRSPKSALGKNTEDSILSGIIYGSAGAVERIISDVENKEDIRFKIVLTGGGANLMKDYVRHDYLEPYLTLKGMRFIYEKNA